MFDPQHLTPTTSLNRVVVTSEGKKAYDLLSAEALTRLIQQQADALGLDPQMTPHELRMSFNQKLGAGHPAAEQIAQEFSRRFYALLRTLKHGTPADRTARPEWDESYWETWALLQTVVLGGGLVSGHLGRFLIEGEMPYPVEISPYARHMALVGAAQYAPPAATSALVFDFGGTWIKRGRAAYKNGTLTRLDLLPPVPSLYTGEALFAHMTALLTETLRQESIFSPILCSVASYVQDGVILEAQAGIYSDLRHFGYAHLQSELVHRLQTISGKPIDLHLIHDGTAAAATCVGMEKTAVILLGTAIGVGFPPQFSEILHFANRDSIFDPNDGGRS